MTRKPTLLGKIALIACCALVFAAIPARAQFIGFVSPQTTTSQPFNNVACTGMAQTSNVANIGQVSHYATVLAGSPAPVGIQVVIQGSFDGTNWVAISANATNITAGNGIPPTIAGSGYYPIVRVQATCLSATGKFTVNYTGSGGTTGPPFGGQLISQVNQVLASGASNTGTGTDVYDLPTSFGSSAGYLNFVSVGTVDPSATINARCDQSLSAQQIDSFDETWPLVSTFSAQIFPVPNWPCGVIEVRYAHVGNGGTSTYNLTYSFAPPGTQGINPGFASHITGTTATAVKAGPGFLKDLVVGTPAAGTISVFDLAGPNCTGTPATNTRSVVTATSSIPTGGIHYELFFQNGICIKASAAMDITAVYQ